MPDRPNVLVVLTDQMRGQAMGCAGNDDVQSPTLDNFAAEGRQFSRAYSPYPVCSPARATMLTGCYPHENRQTENHLRLNPDGQTLAEAFSSAGYETGYVGKWHLDGPGKPGYIPPGERRRGFDYWEGFNRGHDYGAGHPRFTDEGDIYWEEGYQPEVQTDLALDFIDENADGEDPFFMMLSWGPPHTPLDAPAEYSELYDPEELTLRPNVPEHLDGPELRHDLAEYYALITSMDDQFDRLLGALDEQGIDDETLVVFLSDHGEMIGSHGRQRKNYPFEESVRVPLLARYPGEIEPGETEELVSLLDFMPSILGLADVECPDYVQGRDLSDLFRGEEDAEGYDSLYLEGQVAYDEAWRSIRTDRFALTVDRGLVPRYLFDLEEDPYEQENLVDEPEYAAKKKQLRDRMLEMAYDEYDDRQVMAVMAMRMAGKENPLEPRGHMFPNS